MNVPSRCVWLCLVAAAVALAAPTLAADKAAEKPAKAATDKPKDGAELGKKADKPKADAKKDDAKPTDAKTTDAKPADGQPAAKEPRPEDSATPVGDDATKLGPFAPPPRPFPFPLLGDDKAREVFVDRAGNLYKERPYSGNVPDWNAAPSVGSGGRCKVEPQTLSWVGFQNNADGSRVYIQVENVACGYVYRPDDLHIVIDLPQVSIAALNLKREILTGAFPTAIEMIKAEDVPGKGARVVVVLRERRPYLSAHLGRYLFVDVTR
ncbi:MAG: hypothetical protein FJ100_16400 [Deltaproteobacteria bacterium]|nr:hypothetical protein [Deltaproteobacteria bacterium]